MVVWDYARFIAHRGGGTLAPENTLAAITVGKSHGFRAVEFDVMLTKDKIPILMHDEVVGRTVTSSTQKICDHTANEITSLDAGSWFDPKYRDVKVPLFQDVLNYCQEHNVWMNIEIKPSTGFEFETGMIVGQQAKSFFEMHDVSENQSPLISSFSYESLVAAKLAAPDLKRAYLIDNLLELPDWKQKCHDIDAYSVHVNHEHLTSALAKEVKNEGFGLFCYTVNDPERAKELLSWGVDSFCTDQLLSFKNFE